MEINVKFHYCFLIPGPLFIEIVPDIKFFLIIHEFISRSEWKYQKRYVLGGLCLVFPQNGLSRGY